MAVGVKAGTLCWDIKARTAKFDKTIRQTRKKMADLAKLALRIGKKIAGVAASLFSLEGLSKVVQVIGDANETMDRFNAIFGEQAEATGRAAEKLAARVGRAAIEVKASMATFQAFFLGQQFDPKIAAKLSKAITELVLDFASFHNLSDADAQGKFISALSGSAEVLDKYGINIRAAALEQEFLALGINETAENANEAQKILARISKIITVLKDQDAFGNATRTSREFNNLLKAIRGDLINIAVSMRDKLLPALNAALIPLRQLIVVSAKIADFVGLILWPIVQSAFEGIGKIISGTVKNLVSGSRAFGIALTIMSSRYKKGTNDIIVNTVAVGTTLVNGWQDIMKLIGSTIETGILWIRDRWTSYFDWVSESIGISAGNAIAKIKNAIETATDTGKVGFKFLGQVIDLHSAKSKRRFDLMGQIIKDMIGSVKDMEQITNKGDVGSVPIPDLEFKNSDAFNKKLNTATELALKLKNDFQDAQNSIRTLFGLGTGTLGKLLSGADFGLDLNIKDNDLFSKIRELLEELAKLFADQNDEKQAQPKPTMGVAEAFNFIAKQLIGREEERIKKEEAEQQKRAADAAEKTAKNTSTLIDRVEKFNDSLKNWNNVVGA